MIQLALELVVLGTAAVLPEAGGESASFLVNRRILVDAGWCSVLHMRGLGYDPARVSHLLVTHFHHDHYLGLPQLLFYLRGQSLTIAGPAEDLQRVASLAMDLLQPGRFPDAVPSLEFIPLLPGEECHIAGLCVTSCRAIHPVPALSYRLADVESEAAVVLSGDTSYNPGLVELAGGCDALVHEASYGAQAPENNPWGHSGGAEAGRVAAAANVRSLRLVHCSMGRAQEALAAARLHFPEAALARQGEIIAVP